MPVIRVLFLAANPDSTAPLHAGREVRRIRERLAGTAHGSALEILERWAIRPSDLQQALIEIQPHIVHFSGHGSAESELMLEGDDGSPRPVGKRVLAELFRLRGAGVRMVVLSACHSLPQAEAIAEHVGCAIGMRRAFGSEAATEFSAALYHALGSGDSIRRAFESAQLHLEAAGIPEHRTPQLVVRRDGVDVNWTLVDGSPLAALPNEQVQPIHAAAAPIQTDGLTDACADTVRAPPPAKQVNSAPPKYFIYISDSKLNMLFSQLPSGIQNRILVSSRTADSLRMAQLHATVEFLKSHDLVGTIDQPKDYVEGVMDMRWGHYSGGGLVYFGGVSKESIVGLGGSDKHVIGATGQSFAHSASATPALIKALMTELGIDLKGKWPFETPMAAPHLVPSAVQLATTEMQGPLEKLEFIAKTLCTGLSEPWEEGECEKKILLATPLYVASRYDK
jgi:hypothetical protein